MQDHSAWTYIDGQPKMIEDLTAEMLRDAKLVVVTDIIIAGRKVSMR
jgi:hypothetical protein